MRKLLLFLAFVFFMSMSANAQSAKTDSINIRLNRMTLKQVCQFIGIPSSYKARYNLIILPLCRKGVKLFDGKLNKYYSKKAFLIDSSYSCYWYSGQTKQNYKLKRNLIYNRCLFRNGHLIKDAAKKWKIVE